MILLFRRTTTLDPNCAPEETTALMLSDGPGRYENARGAPLLLRSTRNTLPVLMPLAWGQPMTRSGAPSPLISPKLARPSPQYSYA